MTPRLTKCIILTLSFIGLYDTAYLTANHFAGKTPACSLIEGCDVVLVSEFAVILGVPLALIGLLFYLTIFVLTLLLLSKQEEKRERDFTLSLRVVAAFGFVASVIFVLLQAFAIEAWCQYCLLSALTSTLIFIMSFFLKQKLSPASNEPLSHE